MKRLLLHTVIATVICIPLLSADLRAADTRSTFRLQSAGENWGGSRAWPRFRADQRSFRFNGVSGNGLCQFRGSGTKVYLSQQANQGSSVRSNLPPSQRKAQRSYGATARYSSRQRIISYRHYRSSGQANRGATVGGRGR